MSDETGQRGGVKDLRASLSAARETVNRDTPELYEFGPFRLDPTERKLLRGNEVVVLTPKAFDTLLLLVRNSGHLMEKDELIAMLWPNTFVEEGSLSNNIFLLRKALGENPLYIETVPKRGYRFVGAVRQLPNVVPLRPEKPRGELNEFVAPVIPSSGRWPRRTLLAIVASASAMVAIGAALWWRSSTRLPDRSQWVQLTTLAVLPFTNGGDANTDYLSDGITESLIDNLAHVPQLKVKSRNSVFRYKGKDVDVHKVGNALGVSALVSGRVVPRGESIEVSAELIDVRDNTEIWGQHYSGKSTDIVSLQRQIAGDLAEQLRSKISTSERQQVTKQGTQNPEAYELYLKGRYSWNKRTAADLETAISYFNQAIAKDPGYALAYSGLADAYNVLTAFGGAPSEKYPKSNAAARRALELDATLARPHAVLGRNEMEYDWDFAGGEAEYKKAFELDLNDATAHQWYATDISLIGGTEEEALAEINRAHQLDPLSPIISTIVGYVHIWARRYDEAVIACKKLANENPTFADAHRCQAFGYWGKRMYPQVIEEWKAYGQLSGDRNESDFASALEQGFRPAGWKAALSKAIDARQTQRKTGYLSAFWIALLYADLGDKNQAFRWLNTACQERDWWLVGLKTNFLLDPIRSDPRFAELVRKVGLPQ